MLLTNAARDQPGINKIRRRWLQAQKHILRKERYNTRQGCKQVTTVVFAVLMAICSLDYSATAATYDVTRTWVYSSVYYWSTCGDPDVPDTGSVAVAQSGKSFVMVDQEDGTVYSGTANGATYTFSGSFPEDGGTVTVTGGFTCGSNSSGSGSATVTWTDGTYLCSTAFGLSLARQPSSTTYRDYLDTVQEVFIAYYQRPADPGGLVYWARRLDLAGTILGAKRSLISINSGKTRFESSESEYLCVLVSFR